MVNVAFPSHTHASVSIYLMTLQHLTSFARYLDTEHLQYPIGCQINSRPTGRYKNVNCNSNDWLPCVETMIDETLFHSNTLHCYVYPIAYVVVATAHCLRKICVSQMCFLTWEIPADRYRRIGVHMWKLGRVPSLLCYREDTESVSWASPGTCSRTPALLAFTLNVYRNCRLLSSAITLGKALTVRVWKLIFTCQR